MVGGESQAGRISKPRFPEPPHTYRGEDYYGLHAGETANDTDELNNPITLYQNYIDYNQFLSLAVVVRARRRSMGGLDVKSPRPRGQYPDRKH